MGTRIVLFYLLLVASRSICSVPEEGLFKTRAGLQLKLGIYSQWRARSKIQCTQRCLLDENCWGYNYDKTTRNCQFGVRLFGDPAFESQSTGVFGVMDINAERSMKRTCPEWRATGVEDDGFYPIDPDGAGGLDPFPAFCNMSANGGMGATCVGHDSEDPIYVKGFEAPGSFSTTIKYPNATNAQIVAIMAASERCEQYLKYHCRGSFIHQYGLTYGWWLSRDGVKMDYWGGAAPGSRKCACGMTSTCSGGRACHCDNNINGWQVDDGFLNDTSTLPVTGIRAGDTGAFSEKAYVTVGKLFCY